MSAVVKSIGLKGLEGYCVQEEVQVMEGVESMIVVGLPDASVKESRERVSSALHSMGHPLADKRVVVNLSPSEQRKNGPLFDLAIALGVLKSGKFIREKIPVGTAFIGAVSLDGSVVTVQGMLSAVLAAKRIGMKRLFLPFDPGLPPIDIDGLELVYVGSVQDAIQCLAGRNTLPFFPQKESESVEWVHERDFSHVYGHEFAKRALEISAAGGHNVLMDGPPGCGKSLLAETYPSILPPLSKEEQLEKVSLYQLADASYSVLAASPYRHPHHSASAVSIIGGGSNPKPGEVSLAHNGTLFLDELAEFTKKTLDMLRQPLESGKVTISRAHSTVTYPAKFTMIAAMNPCPCGCLGSSRHYCTCSDKQVASYRNKVSGPIRDRMDILLRLNGVSLVDGEKEEREDSAAVRKRVEGARGRQYKRYGERVLNGDVTYDRLVADGPLTREQQERIHRLCMKHGLSNRVQIKVIRLARTIADLSGTEVISDEMIDEAFGLRGVGGRVVPVTTQTVSKR
ncbi:YifB family Mg chelatase-like AAA ATPase [Alteribacter aurantiacus]|uniref:YifB family Mg chelatase-like AAA ATPase n=1 Tax=Alteribacter aurantiacus TaxID=254410 RepID=UPI0006864285|nr:YifB family Mg chelatase-like AAA ATPase [Alteribacter aurantiacus]